MKEYIFINPTGTTTNNCYKVTLNLSHLNLPGEQGIGGDRDGG